MTLTLEREQAPAPAPTAPPRRSRFAQWRGSWRVALRLARRDSWRAKGRSLLVILLIAAPVAAVAAVDVFWRQLAAEDTPAALALDRLGATADAAVIPLRGAVTQDPTGTLMVTSGDAPAPARPAIRAALPEGSRLVPRAQTTRAVIEAGDWGIVGRVVIQNSRDPLLAGLWQLRGGSLPDTPEQIAIAADEARRLHAGVGDAVVVTPPGGTGRTMRISGLVATDAVPDTAAVVSTGALQPDANEGTEDTAGYLVHAPTALTWTDVRALNAIGVKVISRSVITDPPPFCAPTQLCGDHGPVPDPLPQDTNPSGWGQAADEAAFVVVAVVLVVLQVALLAGPAFAVQLRRRQRELGLVGASGGSPSDLRRTVLAAGVVLGVVGATIGVAVGWTTVWLLSGPLPFRPLADVAGRGLGVPGLPVEVLAVAGVGVLAAVVAALIPAVVAGRGDVVATLRGRRELPPIRRRIPVLGIGLGIAGIAATWRGVAGDNAGLAGAGVVAAELGLVVVMPALVVAFGRLGRWLPLSARLAVRDAGRHRLRTATAACAIAAAAAGSVAVGGWAATARAHPTTTSGWVPGTVMVSVTTRYRADGAHPPTEQDFQDTAALIRTIAPDAEAAVIREIIPLLPNGRARGAWRCVLPGATAAQPGAADLCDGRGARNSWLTTGTVLIEDPADVGALLGPIPELAQARAALSRGQALVLTPGVVDDGRLTLRATRYDAGGDRVGGDLVRIPAMVIDSGAVPSDVIVGPAALRPDSPLVAGSKLGGRSIVAAPATTADPDQPTLADRLEIAFAKQGRNHVFVAVLGGAPDVTGIVLAVGGVITLGLALVAGLMVTGLAQVDGSADLTTLAAIGANPGIRRRIAASSAGFVATVGCATGALSGLVAAWLLVPVFAEVSHEAFQVPWAMTGIALIGIPLLTGAVAWLVTPARVPLVRRRH